MKNQHDVIFKKLLFGIFFIKKKVLMIGKLMNFYKYWNFNSS